MYCLKCGKKVGDNEQICPACGTTEFSVERRKARFSATCTLWIVISLAVNAGLGVLYMLLGFLGYNPRIDLIMQPPFFSITIVADEFNIAMFLIGLLLVVYALVYIILLATKKQFLYGVLMVAAISLASFMFFFYGGSVLSIIMIPILMIFPSLTRMFIGSEWDYMD